MDPAAQPNTNSVNNTILPGQFVQIGEEPQVVPSPDLNFPSAPAPQLKMPESAAPEGVVSASPAPIPPPKSNPLVKPFMHLASQTAEVGLTSSNPAPIPPPNQSLPNNSTADLTNSNRTPVPSSSQQPDPTPFVAPGQENIIQTHIQPPEPAKSSNGKIVFFSIGTLALIGIIGTLAYLFVFNKNLPLGARVEDTIKSQLEDLPPLPKRIKGGFADLTPISVFFAQAASPSADLIPNVPAY